MARLGKADRPLVTLTLEARAMAPSSAPVYRASQEEMAHMFSVTGRTLRNWAERGLPVEDGPRGKPVYPFPDANVWAMCYRTLCRESRHGRGPAVLTVGEAHDWHLERQRRESPTQFVIVPLDHDHPYRAAMLRRAAAGQAPPPLEEDAA